MSYDQIHRVSVHIPPCDSPVCQKSLLKFVDLLQNDYCTCFHEYKLNGRYCKWFEEIFLDSTVTIIHKCLQFWKKIEPCLGIFEGRNNEGKVICVDLGNDTPGTIESSMQTFFLKYTTPVVKCDEDFANFISKVKSCLDEKLPKTELPSPITRVHSRQDSATPTWLEQKEQSYYNFASKDDTDVIRIFEDCPCKNESVYSDGDIDQPLRCFPDMFGELNTSDLLVSNNCFGVSTGHTCFKFSNDVSTAIQIQRYINSFKHNEETFVPNCIHCLHKVLPALYAHHSYLGLLIVAVCDLSVLQDRALSLLEVLMLMCPIKQSSLMHNMKTMLKETLLKRNSSVKQKQQQMITRRLANIYMMIQCEMITSCPGQQPVSCCHLREGLSSVDLGNIFWCNLDTFQKRGEREMCQCECVQQVLADVMSAHDAIPKVNDIMKEKLSTQLAVVFGCLRKIFCTNDKATVTYLKKFVGLKTGKKELHIMCTTMILNGFIHFLSHGLKNSMHKDIRDLCSEVMSVIKILSKKDLQEGDSSMLQMLMFDRTPAIRQGIINWFKEKNVYSDNLQLFLLNEVQRLLIPLFSSHGKPIKKSAEDQWLMVSGCFNGRNVVAFIHEPTEENHFHKIKTKFTAKEDLVHLRQAKTLQKLQHQNITTIFAYRLSRIPQFYVLEECMENNLQTALKNRRANNNMLTQSTLISYLADIAAALSYCHEMNIVHRNLTTASVFIVGGNTAKLSDFTLALDLENKESLCVEDNLPLPTRWTSPESLRDCIFSRSSDVWMFGHLIYEMLTHGVLPYSHLNMSDLELALHTITGSVTLSQECEACIKENHWETIVQCVNPNPNSRLSSKELQCIMESHRDSSGSVVTESRIKTRYPDVTMGFRLSSSNHKKAIPGVKVSGGNNSCPNFRALKSLETPHFVTQYSLIGENQFVFREEVQRHFQKDMVQMLHKGHLSLIIPQTTFYIFSQSKEGHFIDCFTPAHEKCSLKITQVISDGETPLEVYLLGLSFLIQVAELLLTLHKNCFVLGDFTNLNFCIDNNMKVHLISVAFLSHISKATSTSTVVTTTSAPVNRKKKKSWVVKPVSVDNDLFCFGKMMLSILQLEKFTQSLSLGLAGKDPILVEIKQNLNDTAVHCARIQTNLNDVSKNLRKHLQTITTTYLQEKDYTGNLSKILQVMSNNAEDTTKEDVISKSIPEKPATPQRPTRPPPKVPEPPHMFSQPETPHMFIQPEIPHMLIQPDIPHMFIQPETPHMFSQPETPHIFSQPLPQPPSRPPPLPPRGYSKHIDALQQNTPPQILPRSKSLGQLLPTNQLSMSSMSTSSVSTPSTSILSTSIPSTSIPNLSIPSMSIPSTSIPLSGNSQNQLPTPKPRRTVQNKGLLQNHSESSLCLGLPTSIHQKDLFKTDRICKTHRQQVCPDVSDTTGNDRDGQRTHGQQVCPDVSDTTGNDRDGQRTHGQQVYPDVSYTTGHRVSSASSKSNLSSGSDWFRRTTYDLTRSNQIPPLQQGLNGVYTTNVVFPHEKNIAFAELRSPMLSSDGSECGSDSTLFSANMVDDETNILWV